MLYGREPSLLCLVASTNSIVLKALRKHGIDVITEPLWFTNYRLDLKT